MSERLPFHLAFPVNDLAEARCFYGELLEYSEGRSSDRCVDFDFYGHQIIAHVSDEVASKDSCFVDGDKVPVRHFGVVLQMKDLRSIAHRLKDADAASIVEPDARFAGQAGEQATLFVLDPGGNVFEYKEFGNPDQFFEKKWADTQGRRKRRPRAVVDAMKG